MSAPALTLAAVRKLSPCESSYRRVSAILPKRGKITAAQAVESGCTMDDLLWVASAISHKDKAIERLLHHWSADCAAHVLWLYERIYPTDKRVRNTIVAARQLADGEIGVAYGDAAWAAAGDAARAAGDAARDAARAAARAAAWTATSPATRAVARAAGCAARWDAGWEAGWEAEGKWQLDRLVYWLTEEDPQPLDLGEPK